MLNKKEKKSVSAQKKKETGKISGQISRQWKFEICILLMERIRYLEAYL